MEAAAAAARAAREREQLFLRAASMGLLPDVEAVVAQGVDVTAVVRAAASQGRTRARAHSALTRVRLVRMRGARARCTSPRRAGTRR